MRNDKQLHMLAAAHFMHTGAVFPDTDDGYPEVPLLLPLLWSLVFMLDGISACWVWCFQFGCELSRPDYSCLSLWINVRRGPRWNAIRGQRVNKMCWISSHVIRLNHLNRRCDARHYWHITVGTSLKTWWGILLYYGGYEAEGRAKLNTACCSENVCF